MDGEIRQTQLFNLKQNPEELLSYHHSEKIIAKTKNTPTDLQRNLSGNPAYAEKLQEMENLLLFEMKKYKDPYRLWNQVDDL